MQAQGCGGRIERKLVGSSWMVNWENIEKLRKEGLERMRSEMKESDEV